MTDAPPECSAVPTLTVALLVSLLATFVAPWHPVSGQEQPAERERVEALLGSLAHDSLRGRSTGSPGARKAARLIAGELRNAGVEPAVGDGYFQPVPMRRAGGSIHLDPEGGAATDERVDGANVVGLIRGDDPERSREAVVVGAHYDHLGVGTPVAGDSIYNGADDDASGVVAVLEAARALATGDPPERTVVFLFSTGEEVGLLGTRWYLERPAVPHERTVANLQVEMIGRPDPLAGGAGRAWLTGPERSTVGEILGDRGIPVVADPRPEQEFFFRSDNIAFARAGIPAHTLSSYGMHSDYHRPSDEIGGVDLDHLVAVVDAVVRSARVLAEGPRPEWTSGGQPPGYDR